MCESYGVAMDSVNGEEVEVVGHMKEMMNDQNVFLYKLCCTCCPSQHQLQYISYHLWMRIQDHWSHHCLHLWREKGRSWSGLFCQLIGAKFGIS